MSDESQKPVTQSYRDNWDKIWGPKCTCPRVMLEDDPCPVHGYPKCKQCGEDEHDFIGCEAARNIKGRAAK